MELQPLRGVEERKEAVFGSDALFPLSFRRHCVVIRAFLFLCLQDHSCTQTPATCKLGARPQNLQSRARGPSLHFSSDSSVGISQTKPDPTRQKCVHDRTIPGQE